MLAFEDRPGLLALTSGVLALHNVSVLGGRFTTRADGVAFQALHVVDALGAGIDDARWAKVRRDIPAALRGTLDLERLLQEKRHAYRRGRRQRTIAPGVSVDGRASASATLVEVHAEDRVGLLHDITRALFEQELDINVAKVDTLGPEVVDVFYVRDLAGHPPRDPAALARIRQAVLARLGG
jgi:[protein-PII] uridylyltransferase